MSNIILSSGENSSLLQTLNQSESKEITSIYSTRPIYAPSATSWYTITPKTGTVANGQSTSYDLPKYGILQQIIFNYDKTITFTADAAFSGKIPKGDFFNLIDRVEFLSSSRILCTLYAEDIVAQLKDLSTDEYSTVSNFLGASAASTVGAGTQSCNFKGSIPLVFGLFMTKSTCPNLAFSEPSQLRVVYRDIGGLVKVKNNAGATPTNIATTVTTNLMLRYKMYSEADTAQLLSSNYEEEQLNMLTSRNYRENPVSFTAGGSPVVDHKFTMELKNVDVAENFYFLVRGPTGVGESEEQNELVEISRVRLTASGQELCDLTKEQLLYMKLSESGWPVNSSYLATQMQDPVAINRVAKIQTGLWTWNKDVWTNGWSMREMNNIVAEVYCDVPANTKLTCYCQELTSCILSQSSNTGRNAISLAN
jgi:hypothetical protein